jgi:hypothetical protein
MTNPIKTIRIPVSIAHRHLFDAGRQAGLKGQALDLLCEYETAFIQLAVVADTGLLVGAEILTKDDPRPVDVNHTDPPLRLKDQRKG